MAACLAFDDLILGCNRHPAVHHLNGVVAKGWLTVAVGANGPGKSTLMKGIVGRSRPVAGAFAIAPGTKHAISRSNRNSIEHFPPGSPLSSGMWPGDLLGFCRTEDRKVFQRLIGDRSAGLACFHLCRQAHPEPFQPRSLHTQNERPT